MPEQNLEYERFKWEQQRFRMLLWAVSGFAGMITFVAIYMVMMGRTEIRVYEEEIRTAQVDIAVLKEEVDRMQSRLDSALAENESLKLRFDTVLSSVKDLEVRLSSVEQTNGDSAVPPKSTETDSSNTDEGGD